MDGRRRRNDPVAAALHAGDPLPLEAGADPAGDSGYPADHPPRKGFFTDTSICIGCKACEVACKQWNGVPDDGFDLLGMSYDNTGALGDSTWRHVAFIEQHRGACPRAPVRSVPLACRVGLGAAGGRGPYGVGGRRSSRRAELDGGRSPGGADRGGRAGVSLADVLGRVQALHARRLPGRVPDRCAVPDRVRHGGRAAGHLQRLRLLRLRLPVRGDPAA